MSNPTMLLKPSDNCFRIIKHFENLKLGAYLDSRGLATIGWGCRYYFDMPGCPMVHLGDAISEDRANILLKCAVERTVVGLSYLIKSSLNQNQTDAITSMFYNVGIAKLVGTHLLDLLNLELWTQAASNMLTWDHEDGIEIAGLKERRQEESALFLSDE